MTAFPKTSSRRRRGTSKAASKANADHLAWIREQPCAVPGCRVKRIEAHHVRTAANAGTGVKPPDSFAIGLCQYHHTRGAESIHQLGQDTFAARHGIDLERVVDKMRLDSPHI